MFLVPKHYFRLMGVACVGIAVIGTFLVCWAPFSRTPDDILAVIHRLFPFSRGLFEVNPFLPN